MDSLSWVKENILLKNKADTKMLDAISNMTRMFVILPVCHSSKEISFRI